MAQEINSLKIDKVFSWKKVRGPCASACGILLVLVMAYTAYPGLSENAFKRWGIPFSSLERKTLTEILNHKTKSYAVLKNETRPAGSISSLCRALSRTSLNGSSSLISGSSFIASIVDRAARRASFVTAAVLRIAA